MKKNILLAVFSVCFLSQVYSQFSSQTIPVGAATRNFRQYLPTGFNAISEPGLPLVIALHGLGDNATNFSNVGFHQLADTARFLVVYLNGTLNGFGQNAWNNGTLLSSAADDINFISRVIDSMYVRHNIDLSKVYVTGFSMGGIMSYHALCGLPDRIAAIASVAGTMSTSDIDNCDPGRAVPVMHLHGTADGTVPYTGSGLPSLSTVPATIDFWKDNNSCTDSVTISLPNVVAADSITVDKITYSMCTEPVELWRENNADHQWLYNPANDIDATTQIWLFFRDKSHPAPSPLAVSEKEKTGFVISSFYNGLSVSCDQQMQEISITDLQGRNIVQRKGSLGNQQEIMLREYAGQVYIVKVKSGDHWMTKKFTLVK